MNDKEKLIVEIENVISDFRKAFSNPESTEDSRKHLFLNLSRLTGWSIKWVEVECLFNGFHKPNAATCWHLWEVLRLFDLHNKALQEARLDYEGALKDMYEYTIMQLTLRKKESDGKVKDFELLQLHLFEKEERLNELENELKQRNDFQCLQQVELKKLKEELKIQVQQKIQEQGTTFGALLKENSILKDETQQLKEKLKRLETERERILEGSAMLKGKMKYINQECIELKRDLLIEKENVKSLEILETQNSDLQDEISQLTKQLENEMGKSEHLQDALKMTEMQMETEKELNMELRGQVNVLKGFAEKQEQFENLREELNQHRVWRSLVKKVVTQEPQCLSA